MKTAEQYIKELDEETGTTWTENNEGIAKAFHVYARQVAEAVRKECAVKVKTKEVIVPMAEDDSWKNMTGKNHLVVEIIDRDSILNADIEQFLK